MVTNSSSSSSNSMTLSKFFLLVILLVCCPTLLVEGTAAIPSMIASWQFAESTSDAQDWIKVKQGSNVQAQPGCCVQGEIIARDPFIQSPVLDLDINNKQVIIINQIVQGPGRTSGGVYVLPSNAYDSSMTDEQLTNSNSWIFVSFSATVVGDGQARIMHAPIWKVMHGRIALIRVVPAYKSATAEQQQEQQPEPQGLGFAFSIEWIKVITAPTITRVTGCVDKFFQNVGESPEAFRSVELRSPVSTNQNDKWFDFTGQVGTMLPHELEQQQKLSKARLLHEHWQYRIVNGGVGDLIATHVPLNRDATVHVTDFRNGLPDAAYAVTYNCQRGGGDTILVEGHNFGGSLTPSWSASNNMATITIGGRPCLDVSVVESETALKCRTPPMDASVLLSNVPSAVRDAIDRVPVQVRNRDFDLTDSRAYFAYVVPPVPLENVRATNVASRSVDVVWDLNNMPMWDALTITGFVVQVMQQMQLGVNTAAVDVWSTAQVVSNVSTTTVRGLLPDTPYRFRVAALSENQKGNKQERPDLYGRRAMRSGAIIGAFSNSTNTIRTLTHDVDFPLFNANSSLVHGAHFKGDTHNTLGLTNDFGGHGNFGLRFVGQASVANCNSSHTCCDKTQEDGDECEVMCTSVAEIGNIERNNDTTHHPNGLLVLSGLAVSAVGIGSAEVMPATCGSTLRLTSSVSRSVGASWYGRQLNVREGFTTEFVFRLSAPSQVCSNMNDVKTHCRYRGADGFAFVLQTSGSEVIGRGGSELGYGGLMNALAVEFDTHFNAERNDPFDNHVAVFASGRSSNSNSSSENEGLMSEHAIELASAAAGLDMADGRTHVVRITYVPVMQPWDVQRDNHVIGERAVDLLLYSMAGSAEDEDNPGEGGEEDSGDTGPDIIANTGGMGMGVLRVFVDDMLTPLLSTSVNIETALQLQSGRAWIGFTAATGESSFQTHEIYSWKFSALRQEVS